MCGTHSDRILETFCLLTQDVQLVHRAVDQPESLSAAHTHPLLTH